MTEKRCDVRMPDNTDFWPCGKPVFRENRCETHFLEMISDIKQMREATKKILDEYDAILARNKNTNRVYFASKVKHAPLWRKLRETGLVVKSTWINEAGEDETKDYKDLWFRCVSEAATCSHLVLYCEDAEVMKGALVEMGAALGAGARVLWVGVKQSGSCWQHPRVKHFESLTEALAVLETDDSKLWRDW